MKKRQDKQLEKVDHEALDAPRDERVYVPVTDIYEKDNAILVRCEMPGVAQDQVDIHLDQDQLEIVGRQKSAAPDGDELLLGEYGTGVFRRKFSIPQLIDRERIQARLRNGILDIELPKAAQAQPRKIAITAG